MTGLWTDIVKITAPESASSGQTVNVSVDIKNLLGYAFYIAASALVDGSWVSFTPAKALTQPGASSRFSSSFVMPNKDVTLTITSYFVVEGEWGDEWYPDDQQSVVIALEVAVAGTITRMELEYDGARANIPAYDIPQDKSGQVHIWGRNDSAVRQDLGIRWLIYDPNGILVQDYPDWSYGHGPGDDHEFIGPRFDLDKPGPYTITLALSMNPAAPQIVASYSGVLCTVAAAVPEPEFRGFGFIKYVTA
ncbi:unnamed protein product [marine sediment metagenome]|uniref:Uncharacterized protein n=1 Tax=marine sediment metagenome TaxID=412755 RepID=X1RNH3_9ZZZZ